MLWKDDGSLALAGRLELDSNGLWLHGGDRRNETRLGIPYREMQAVERNGNDRIGPCRAIRIRTRAAGRVLIASLGGVGVLGEILDLLLRASSV